MAPRRSTSQKIIRSARLCRLGRGNPNTEKNRDQADDKIQGNWLVNELRRKQRGRYGIDGHGVGHPRRCCPLQRQNPENEGERSAAAPQICARNPLRRSKVAKDKYLTGGKAHQYQGRCAKTHADGEESERARP